MYFGSKLGMHINMSTITIYKLNVNCVVASNKHLILMSPEYNFIAKLNCQLCVLANGLFTRL